MRISNKTVKAVEEIITGNNNMTPYRSGPKLVDFFNQFGWNETYGQGFPSRHVFAERKIQEANGTSKLDRIIQAAIDPRDFLGTAFSVDEAVNYLNQFLKYDGYEIIKTDLFYEVQVLESAEITGRKGAEVKNIIFAANGPKPEIVLVDAITNEVKIVSNEEYCLIYDREVADEDGLSWGELVDWWCERHRNSSKSRGEYEWSLISRLNQAMNEVEQKFFIHYFARFPGALGGKLPALLPQVYLHYDPYTLRQLAGQKRLPRQRMDFMLLLPQKRRIVIEIDGVQHYSENGLPSPKLYAEMVSEDRRLMLAGYEVYRFGGYELKDPDISELVTDFFSHLLS